MLRFFFTGCQQKYRKYMYCTRSFKWRYMSHELPEDPDVKDDIRFHYL